MKQHVSPGNFQVIVGENAIENYRLCKEILSGNDIWFHASGKSSAHIILKVPKARNAFVTIDDYIFCENLLRKDDKSLAITRCKGCDVEFSKYFKIGSVLVCRNETPYCKSHSRS